MILTHSQPKVTYKETIQVALVLLLLLLAFFWPAVFGGKMLLPTDLIFDQDPLWQPLAPSGYIEPANALLTDQAIQFFPWKVFTLRSFDQGHLPLWNPYTNGGQSFVGNALSGVFDPFNLVSYLFSLYNSFVIVAILRLFIAGFFTFLFTREIGLSRLGALLSVVVFTFSGPMIVWVGHPNVSAMAWLPALLFTTERLLTRKNNLYLILSGLIIGIQFLGGHPETSFHVLLAWGVYSLYRTATLRREQTSRLLPQLLQLAGVVIMGVLVAAVQLLPFVEALLHSAILSARQAEAAGGRLALLISLALDWQEWPSVITAVLPQYFGTPMNNSYWYLYSNYIELSTYAGILPLALAASITFHSLKNRSAPRRKLVLFLALMAVICLGIALHFPLINAFNHLPIFNIAANGRLRLVYVLMIAILAGLGLDEASGDGQVIRQITLRLLIGFALLSLILIVLTYIGFTLFREEFIRNGRAFVEAREGTPYLSHPLEYYYHLVEERQERKLALFRPSNIVMYLPILVACFYFALCRWGNSLRLASQTWPYVILTLTILDLFLVGMPFNPTTSPEQIYPTPDAIKFLKQDPGIYRVSATGLILNPNSGMVFNLADIRGYDPVTPRRYLDLISRLEGHFPIHYHSLFIKASSPLFDLLNVKYVLTEQQLTSKWKLVYQDEGPVKVYQNQDVLPRAFMVYKAEIVETAEASLERVIDKTFNFKEAVVLEKRPSGWTEPPEISQFSAEVNIIDYQPNQMILKVATTANGLLILTDTYMPGWKARLDGQETQVYIANHAFRAVVVPAGTHQIKFIYQPLTFWIGSGISLLSLFFLLAWLLSIIKGSSK